MPYPGGKHAPGHYAAGIGGPPAGAIFLRSVAAYYDSQFDGNGSQAIPNPPSVTVGDDLFVFLTMANESIAGPVGTGVWTIILTGIAPLFGFVNVWTRVATGIGTDDDFVMPATTFYIYAQMCSVGNNLQPVEHIIVSQTGTPFGANGIDWDVNAIATGGTPTDTAVFLFAMRANEPLGAGPFTVVDANPTTMQTIGERAGQRPLPPGFPDTLWTGWYFLFQAVSAGLALFEQGYTPDPTSADQFTNFLRFRQTP